MKYGATIPPKTFFSTAPQFFTKQGFANYMTRALQSVGMLPLTSINSYDLADPANAERDPGASENAYFWLDYPEATAFWLGTVPYRPCVAILNSVWRGWTTSGDGATIAGKTYGYNVGYNFGFRHTRRRADRIARDDMRNATQLVDNRWNNYGLGFANDVMTSYMRSEVGSIVGWNRWKLFASWGDANMQQLLFVSRVFVHLGPAGLFVQVGTHPTRRDETCNIMNFAAVFHGGRIPNRAYPVIDDVLRDRIDPVAWLDLGAYTDDSFANQTRAKLNTLSFGTGTTFNNGVAGSTTSAVTAEFLSIDYQDDGAVVNAPADNYARPSPTVLNGSGVHLLHRAAVYNPAYGRRDSVKQPNLLGIFKWEDLFYAHGFALGDRVAPPGLNADPNTGKDWYMIWSTPRGQAFGIDYDGTVTLPALTAGAEVLNLEQTVALDVTALPQTFANYHRASDRGTRDIVSARTTLGTFDGVTAYMSQVEYSNVDVVEARRWRKVTAENGFSLVDYGWTSWDGTKEMHLILDLEGLSTDYRDFYWVEYDYRARIPTSPGANQFQNDWHYHYAHVGPGNAFTKDSYAAQHSFQRAGSSTQPNLYYNYQRYGVYGQHYPASWSGYDSRREVTRFQADTNGRAVVMFSAYHNYNSTSSSYFLNIDIRNIVLKRYRRT